MWSCYASLIKLSREITIYVVNIYTRCTKLDLQWMLPVYGIYIHVYTATLVNLRLCGKSVSDHWHVALLKNKYVHDVPSHDEIIFLQTIHNKYRTPWPSRWHANSPSSCKIRSVFNHIMCCWKSDCEMKTCRRWNHKSVYCFFHATSP